MYYTMPTIPPQVQIYWFSCNNTRQIFIFKILSKNQFLKSRLTPSTKRNPELVTRYKANAA